MEERKKAFFYPEVTAIGGSLGIIIPKDIVDTINLLKGDRLEVMIEITKRSNNKEEEKK